MKAKCSQLTPEILPPRSQISRHSCNQCNAPIPPQWSYLKDLKSEVQWEFTVLQWQFLLGFSYITRNPAALFLILLSINYNSACIHSATCHWECGSSGTTKPSPYLACDHQALQTALKSQLLCRQICSPAMRGQTGGAHLKPVRSTSHFTTSAVMGWKGTFLIALHIPH